MPCRPASTRAAAMSTAARLDRDGTEQTLIVVDDGGVAHGSGDQPGRRRRWQC